eukprot:66458-Rhodomonas_salina.3
MIENACRMRRCDQRDRNDDNDHAQDEREKLVVVRLIGGHDVHPSSCTLEVGLLFLHVHEQRPVPALHPLEEQVNQDRRDKEDYADRDSNNGEPSLNVLFLCADVDHRDVRHARGLGVAWHHFAAVLHVHNRSVRKEFDLIGLKQLTAWRVNEGQQPMLHRELHEQFPAHVVIVADIRHNALANLRPAHARLRLACARRLPSFVAAVSSVSRHALCFVGIHVGDPHHIWSDEELRVFVHVDKPALGRSAELEVLSS